MSLRRTLILLSLVILAGCNRAPSGDQLRDDARQAAQRGEATKALSLYTRAIEAAPKLAGALAERGQLYASIGETEHALGDFDAALAAEPNQPVALRERGRLRRAAGQYAEAIADYTQALATQPQNATVLVERGICQAHLQKHAEAVADLDAALAVQSQLAPAYQARALSLMQLGRLEQAALDFHQADLLKTPLNELVVPWCQTLLAIGKQSDAERVATRGLKESPDHVELLYLRGQVRQAAKNYADASADFDRVVQLAPARLDAQLSRAHCKNRLGQLAAARDDFSQVLQADAKHLVALGERARLQLLLHNPAAAKDDCEAWLAAAGKSAGGDWARLMAYRALAQYQLSDWTAAQDDARAALNADPERHDARCVWALAALVEPAGDRAAKQAAVERLTELLGAFPNDARLLNLRAIAYLVQGDAALALADADTALQQSDAPGVAIATRVVALLRLQRTGDALAVLQRLPASAWHECYAARRLTELLATLLPSAESRAGIEALQSRQWQRSLQQATLAMGAASRDPLPSLVRGTVLCLFGNRDAGLVDLQRAIGQTADDDPLGRHLRALVALERSDFKSASQAALDALRKAPDDAALHVAHLLGALGTNDKQTVALDGELVAALDTDALLAVAPLLGNWSRPSKDPTVTPLPIELLVPSTMLLAEKPEPTEETLAARRATAAKLLAQAGQTYYLASKYAQSVERYDLALTLEKQPEWFAGRAAAQYALQQLPAAIDDFTQAITLRPNQAAYHFNRANAYMSQQAFDLALADYSRVIELEPDNSEAYRHRAKIYAVRKDEVRAEADLERARKLKVEGK